MQAHDPMKSIPARSCLYDDFHLVCWVCGCCCGPFSPRANILQHILANINQNAPCIFLLRHLRTSIHLDLEGCAFRTIHVHANAQGYECRIFCFLSTSFKLIRFSLNPHLTACVTRRKNHESSYQVILVTVSAAVQPSTCFSSSVPDDRRSAHLDPRPKQPSIPRLVRSH